MKKINALIISCLLLLLVKGLSAQTYKVGDLITFPDNSKGIVCYVDPNDTRRGWAMALTDLPNNYDLLGSGGSVTGLELPVSSPGTSNLDDWHAHGKHNTLRLLASGKSPAANAVDVLSGWYIPDIQQLDMMYRTAPFLENSILSNGGSTGAFLTVFSTSNNTSNIYASSTPSNNNSNPYFYAINMAYYGAQAYPGRIVAISSRGVYNDGFKIRPVRDFGNEVEAYWVAPYNATGEKTNTMTVTPDETTTYDAVVVSGHDTFPATSTVAVQTPSTKSPVCVTTEPAVGVTAAITPIIPPKVPSSPGCTFVPNRRIIITQTLMNLIQELIRELHKANSAATAPLP